MARRPSPAGQRVQRAAADQSARLPAAPGGAGGEPGHQHRRRGGHWQRAGRRGAPRGDGATRRCVTQAKVGYILSGYGSLKGLVSIDLFTPAGGTSTWGTCWTPPRCARICASGSTRATLDSQAVHRLARRGGQHQRGLHPRKVLVATRLLRRVDPSAPEPRAGGHHRHQLLDRLPVRALQGLDLGAGGYLMVVDSQGRLLFHPDKSLHRPAADARVPDAAGRGAAAPWP